MKILDYLKNNILITDGSMGTYYRELSNTNGTSVVANLTNPDIIEKIHKDYIGSGAMLIRTNTFSANTQILKCDIEYVKEVISKGCEIAKKAVSGTDVFIGASIGPIPDGDNEQDFTQEYFDIVDCFLSQGIDIFVFETFYSLDYLKTVIEHIKEKNKNAFIITQFSVNDTGITKKSLGINRIISELKDFDGIDVIGFNCGVGPMHMYNIVKKISNVDFSGKMISALPNAGYPEIIDNKVEYVMNPKYFAKTCAKMISQNVKVIGGCCGTTPEHIRLLKEELLKSSSEKVSSNVSATKVTQAKNNNIKNAFHSKLENNEFIIAVELDPPFKTSVDKIITGAKVLSESGVDIITIADSPMGKSRADSMIISSKIKRETGAEVLPHVCCRDRNSISLRSSILAGYIEGIRNVLVVTGDPVPEEARGNTKSVFDLNSYSLMNMISEMNLDVFEGESVKIGGAVNFNVKNKSSEYNRLLRKVKSGAEFFLTQPIFTDDTIEFIKGLPKERDFKIFGGIMPLVTYNNAQFINNEMTGINIPERYLSMFSPDMSREESQAIGIEIAVELAKTIRDYVDGLYIITPFNRYEMVSEILKKIKN